MNLKFNSLYRNIIKFEIHFILKTSIYLHALFAYTWLILTRAMTNTSASIFILVNPDYKYISYYVAFRIWSLSAKSKHSAREYITCIIIYLTFGHNPHVTSRPRPTMANKYRWYIGTKLCHCVTDRRSILSWISIYRGRTFICISLIKVFSLNERRRRKLIVSSWKNYMRFYSSHTIFTWKYVSRTYLYF